MPNKKETRSLPVSLTEEEFKIRASMLASNIEEHKERIESIKEAKKEMAEELKEMERQIGTLSTVVDTKREYRSVQCTWIADYARCVWRLTRDDTGEEVDVESMTKGDMQEKIIYPLSDRDLDEEEYDPETGEVLNS